MAVGMKKTWLVEMASFEEDQKKEYVLRLALYGGAVELAIIGNTPPSLEFAEQMRKRRLGNGVTDEFFMDKFDDSYTIYDTHPGGHTHVESQFVFPTRKPVSEKLVQKLKEQLEKGD